MYAIDLKMDVQLATFPDLVRTDHQMTNQMVTSMSMVCELFNTSIFPKTMLSEVHRFYLTVQLTFATAERTFSTL